MQDPNSFRKTVDTVQLARAFQLASFDAEMLRRETPDSSRCEDCLEFPWVAFPAERSR